MNNFKIALVLILISQLARATEFKLEFIKPRDLNIELKLYELNPISFAKAVGTQGELVTDEQLEKPKPIKNFTFKLGPADGKVLALVAENKTAKDIEFFVSPHESNPSEFSLDFKFNCLCYSHIYKIKSKKKWYRIMRLQRTDDETSARTVRLKHTIVKWNPKDKH